MDSENLTLNSIIAKQKYKVKISSENFEDPKDADHRRWKEKLSLYLVMICIILTLVSLFLYIFLSKDNTHHAIALSGIISIVIGVSGYYLKGDK